MHRLLVVDDETEMLRGYVRFFPWEAAGFRVAATASSGEEALRILASQPVDAMLCDIEMPGMSGIELVRRVRQMWPVMPIIILSGYHVFDYARQMIDYGAVAYVLKSDKNSVLLEALRKAAVCLGSAPRSDNEVVRQLYRYVEEHLDTATLQDAAAQLHISPSYLSRLFKDSEGVNFQQYLIQKKMRAAKIMLTRQCLRVGEISQRLGYADTQSFIRAFKKHTGMTPLAFLDGVRRER